MALPNVNITVNRSGLGLVDFTNDGIMGIALFGSSVPGKVQIGVPNVVYSLEDSENMGITENGDNSAAWKQIKEFYDESGSGMKLWIILSNKTEMSAIPASEARRLLAAANGEISVIGLCRGGENQSGELVDGLNQDVWNTMSAIQLLADEYQAMMMPFSAVIDGIGFSGDENAISDLHEKTLHRCSVILSASKNDGVASVGQCLGRLASIPVQRKLSRVKDGALRNSSGFLTDGEKVDDRLPAMGVLHDKGYIVYRTFPGRSGYYYSGDPTATAETDDLNTIARNRIIDKTIKIAYNVYVEELDDDIPVTDDGKIEPAVCGYLQSKIEQQVAGNMAEEISSFSAYVDPDQNILSGAPIEVALSIVPKGYLSQINVTIGFTNPLLTE